VLPTGAGLARRRAVRTLGAMSDHEPSRLPPSPTLSVPATTASDVVLRALTDEGSVRAVVVGLDRAAAIPIALHARTEREASAFGELLAAAVLVRETVAPGLRIQMTLRGERGGHLVADSFPDGLVRGFIARPGDASPDAEVVFGPSSALQVSRQMPDGRLHQSVVPVEVPRGTGGERAVAAAVEAYLQSSEQIAASSDVAAFAAPVDEQVAGEGGPARPAWRVRARLVQIMPGANREVVARVTERLAHLGAPERRRGAMDVSPASLVGALLGDEPHTVVSAEPLHHGCRCSEDKVLAALATLGPDDLRAVVEGGEDVELSCDYCKTAYRFPATKVAGLLTPPATS